MAFKFPWFKKKSKTLSEKKTITFDDCIKQSSLKEMCGHPESKKIDSTLNYDLFLIGLPPGNLCILKMKDPSTTEIHYRLVDPACLTVKHAIAWRNQTTHVLLQHT